jgi:lysophospholipase L1-like esterase
MRLASLLVLALCTSPTFAQSAWEPAPRTKEYVWMSTATWKQKHESLLKRTKEGKIDLLFLGDSITEGWGNNAVWKTNYAPLNAANYGIGGDTTENVLWRIGNGELEGLKPKVVVLLIGTNNFGLENARPDDVARGVTAVVETLQKKLPAAKILLLGIFPRDAKPGADFRKRILAANAKIAELDDKKSVRYLDIGPKFLDPEGNLSNEIMPDLLHLSTKGYEIWADAMAPLLKEMLGDK